MRKSLLFIFLGLFCLHIYAQNADLYDVNFDAPKTILEYDNAIQVFQDIYLQYESTIRKSEENIRSEEKNIRQDDAQKFQENLDLEQKKAQEEQRKQQEELAQAKFNFEQELAQVQQKAQEAEIKHQEELVNLQNDFQEKIAQTESKFKQELIQEQNKAKEELAQALEKQKKDIYANEIEQLRKDEYEKLSIELHDSITNELTKKFETEYEVKVEQLTTELTAEYEKKLKEESDKFASEYEAKITEIERQKESEIEAWKKENKKQALEETNAMTERMRIVAPYIGVAVGIGLFIFFVMLWKKKDHRKEEEQRRIKNYAIEYSNRLKRVGSSNVYRDEIKNIYEEIEKSEENEIEKMLRREALGLAEKEFDKLRITLSIDEYRKKFDDLNPQRFFSNWNVSGDDIEAKKAVISNFSANIAEYEKYAISAYNSKNDSTDIANMLKPYVPVLKSNSDQLASIKDSESDESLKEQLSDLSIKYHDLADKFNKGKF